MPGRWKRRRRRTSLSSQRSTSTERRGAGVLGRKAEFDILALRGARRHGPAQNTPRPPSPATSCRAIADVPQTHPDAHLVVEHGEVRLQRLATVPGIPAVRMGSQSLEGFSVAPARPRSGVSRPPRGANVFRAWTRSASVPVSTFLAQAARSSRNQFAPVVERFPLRLPESGRVIGHDRRQPGRRRAGGVEPVTGAEVLGQLGCGGERLGIEASGRGEVLLDETEFRQVTAVRRRWAEPVPDDGAAPGDHLPGCADAGQRCRRRSGCATRFSPSETRIEAPPNLSGLGLANSRRASTALPRPHGRRRIEVRAGRLGGSHRWLPSVGPRPAGECGWRVQVGVHSGSM